MAPSPRRSSSTGAWGQQSVRPGHGWVAQVQRVAKCPEEADRALNLVTRLARVGRPYAAIANGLLEANPCRHPESIPSQDANEDCLIKNRRP